MLQIPLILVILVSFIFIVNHWGQNKGVIYLVFIALDKALTQFALLELNATQDPTVFSLVYHLEPLIVLQGPFFLYYLKSIMKGAIVWDKYLLLLSIPSLLFLINLLPFYALPFPDRVAYFSDASVNPGLKGYLFLSLSQQYLFISIYNTAFIIYGVLFINKLKAGGGVYIKKKVNILITRIFIVALLTIIPSLVVLFFLALNSAQVGMIDFLNPDAVNNNYLYFQSLVLPLSFFFVPNWLYNEKEPFSFLDNFSAAWKKVIQSNSMMVSQEGTLEKSSDVERIVSYIETEKPYLQTDFSLHDISQALNIPRIRVTNCFNKELQTPFPSYRNKLRVAHAISLLRAGAHLTTSIEGIAERSGFKSKSIFYAAFKEEYGTTPTDWIKKHL
jgi:AraC-like DNA-binding protein